MHRIWYASERKFLSIKPSELGWKHKISQDNNTEQCSELGTYELPAEKRLNSVKPSWPNKKYQFYLKNCLLSWHWLCPRELGEQAQPAQRRFTSLDGSWTEGGCSAQPLHLSCFQLSSTQILAGSKRACNKVITQWLWKYFAQFDCAFVTRLKSELEKATILCCKSCF